MLSLESFPTPVYLLGCRRSLSVRHQPVETGEPHVDLLLTESCTDTEDESDSPPRSTDFVVKVAEHFKRVYYFQVLSLTKADKVIITDITFFFFFSL